MYIREEEIKSPLLIDEMIVYVETPNESLKKLLELVSEFSKMIKHKSLYEDQLYSYIPGKEERDLEIIYQKPKLPFK